VTQGSRPIVALLVLYLILASVYSIIDPLFEASDEQWHYPTVKYIADHGFSLPVQDRATTPQTMWRQEGGQPPLYYFMGAALTFWIDTSDLATVRRLNPHADIGTIVPDGNANMMIHDPTIEAFPWHGTVLAVHLIRLMSVLMGAVTVYMTCLLALELFPDRRWLAITAAAIVALNPMFLFISGSVNNDNLSNMLASILLVQIVRLLKRTAAPSWQNLVAIGGVAGAGMLAKFNIGFLLPLIALSLALLAWRLRTPRVFVMGSLVTGILTIAIAGWWYVRNQTLYHDPTGLNVFLDIVGRRNIPATLAQLWTERDTFMWSYWGFFGGVNVLLPDLAYLALNLIALIAGIGLIVGLIRWVRPSSPVPPRTRKFDLALLIGASFTILWIGVLFVSLLRWTSETWASQGRLMFSAIAPISVWMAVGVWAVPRIKALTGALTILVFLSVGAVVGPTTISRAYDPEFRSELNTATPSQNVPCTNGGNVKCFALTEPGQSEPALTLTLTTLSETEKSVKLAYPCATDQVNIGEYYRPCLGFHFHVNRKMSHDWSIFIHLVNDQGMVVAQRDRFPDGGLRATSLMQPGQDWADSFVVYIPDHIYLGQKVSVYFGLYDNTTGQKMLTATPDNQIWLASLQLLGNFNHVQYFSLLSGDSIPPNTTFVNFGDQAEFVGYAMSSLLAHPGDKLTVTLYWRAKQPMRTDYRVFVQLLQPYTSNTIGKSDAMPVNWARPTSTWKPGEIIQDEHTFSVDPNAPPGTWQIAIGMYQLTQTASGANQFQRLPIVNPDGGQTDDMLYLTRVKIDPPPKPDDF
jgi:4-amino-4-deoxy-L-arabinose transferase-like glycosyltransferase